MAHACIGTSGWSYREWRGNLYPPGVRPGDYLAHYATHFPSVEVNATAYGLPPATSVERWCAMVPERFIFAVKASHRMTHHRRLRGCAEDLRAFAAAIAPFGAHLGPVLFQLPPSLEADAGLLGGFFSEARAALGAQPLVCEFRHPSWYRSEVYAVLQRLDVTCCVHDMPGSAISAPPYAGLLYLRRHGTAGRYVGAYGRDRLLMDAQLIADTLAAGHSAFAYFNNTADGAAIADVQALLALLAELDENR